MLVNRLVKEDISLRLFARNRRRLNYLKDSHDLSICDIELKAENEDIIARELHSVEVVYYLMHSMSRSEGMFGQVDVELAKTISSAAAQAGVKQIIYLGGLGIEEEGYPLSGYLRSTLDTGDVLRKGSVPVTEIRAGIIIGAGSVSFEIIRALAQKLPFMPRVAFNKGRCQPIDIDDVITYLFHAHLHPSFIGKILEIGMDETFGYDEMVLLFAKYTYARKVPIVRFPFIDKMISKRVFARTIAFFSAIPYELAFPLVDGMDSQSVKGEFAYEAYHTSCALTDDMVNKNALLGNDLNILTPLSFEESVKKAFSREAQGQVESFWSMPHSLQVLTRESEEFLDSYEEETEGLLFEKRVREVDEDDVAKIFAEVLNIGGEHGYWSPQWMWSSRAIMDKFIGGPGLDLGRRTFDKVPRVGERMDFWIVTEYLDMSDKKVFTLKGRLKSPGDSWLQFALIQDESDQKRWRFILRAYFRPSGVAGYLYWYSLFFIHKYIFTAMIDKIIKNALAEKS